MAESRIFDGSSWITITDEEHRNASDPHTLYALADGTRGAFAAPLEADDNYVTDAEKAALHAHSNKAALDLVEVNADDGEVVFSVVDNAGRRSWLEVSPSGAPPERVKTLIQGWAKELAPPGGGYAYAVVDDDGSISELALEESGQVPQWVIDRWASRMALGIPTVTLPEIEVPSIIYALIGAEAQMIHKNYIKALSKDYNVKVTNGVNGTRTLNDRWKVNAVSATSSAITVSVIDRAMAQVATLTTTLVTNDATLATPCRLLPIGDSITRSGVYAKTGAQLVGGDTYGTRTIGGIFNEGRGGWTLSNYMSNIGTAGASAMDSPFIFPVGVAPAMFLGNTDFWKGVVSAGGPSDYGWAGFQQMARAGFATSGPFLFDATGYPVTPAEGNVVIDPTQAAGSTWRKYTAGAWTTMTPQPSTEFSFASYMTRYAAAFAGGDPTVISIMLGTNDFYAAYTDAAFTTFAGRMDTLIASIRAWSATVPIILCTAPAGGYQDDWPTAGVHEFEYRERMYQFTRSMITKYDTAATRTNKVYLSSFLGAVDDADFGPTNTVHPDTPGHTSMGQWLAGAIANALN